MSNFMPALINGAKANAPHIALGAGLALGVVSIVFACKQTLKAGDILDRHNAEIDKIEEAKKVADEGEYTESDIKKDTILVWRGTIKDMAKCYAVPAGIGVASVGLILIGYGVLNSRFGGATAALGLTQSMFSKYRSRVVEDQGVEKDRQYLYGSVIKKKAIEVEETDPETGKVKKKKVDAEFIDIDVDLQTGAIRVFSDVNPDGSRNYEWSDNIDICLATLRAKQNYWAERLEARGHIFLNEVAIDVGLNPTQAGQVLGWTWKPGRDPIDFGLGDYSDPQVRRFINGRSDCLILHFNIDGEYDSNHNLLSATPIIGTLEA